MLCPSCRNVYETLGTTTTWPMRPSWSFEVRHWQHPPSFDPRCTLPPICLPSEWYQDECPGKHTAPAKLPSSAMRKHRSRPHRTGVASGGLEDVKAVMDSVEAADRHGNLDQPRSRRSWAPAPLSDSSLERHTFLEQSGCRGPPYSWIPSRCK